MSQFGRVQVARAISSELSTPPGIEAIAEAIGAAVASVCGLDGSGDALRVEDRARRAALGVLKLHLGTGEHELPRRR